MKAKPPMPPWLRDPDPDRWTTASVAAKFYFRKSLVTVKRYIKSGYLEANGFKVYWDGTRWFIRLPYSLNQSQNNQKPQKQRIRA